MNIKNALKINYTCSLTSFSQNAVSLFVPCQCRLVFEKFRNVILINTIKNIKSKHSKNQDLIYNFISIKYLYINYFIYYIFYNYFIYFIFYIFIYYILHTSCSIFTEYYFDTFWH